MKHDHTLAGLEQKFGWQNYGLELELPDLVEPDWRRFAGLEKAA